YVCACGPGSVATAGDPKSGTVVLARSRRPLEDTKAALIGAGLEVEYGRWMTEGGQEEFPATPFVAAVAFKSREGTAGIWVDAFPELPSQTRVLRAMYDELRATGEVGEVSFETFVRLAAPNVAVVSPEDLAKYAEQNATDESSPHER
ncbi:MAG: hypothetical protein SNJ74_10570, partial [Fimbriimonadaceae bacterium]